MKPHFILLPDGQWLNLNHIVTMQGSGREVSMRYPTGAVMSIHLPESAGDAKTWVARMAEQYNQREV